MHDFDISISSHCNASCPSCKRFPDFWDATVNPNQQLHHNLNQIHMSFDDFKSIILRNSHNFIDKNVMFEGELGDPMVNPEIKKFIDFGCEIFKKLSIVTNGGNRKSNFYFNLGETYKNLEMTFSIDGLNDDTNQIYRKRVNTEKALENMIAFSKSKYGYKKTYWQFLVFEHNFFEIPEVLDFAKKYDIMVYIKINQRPKFKISSKRLSIAKNLYVKNKNNRSEFLFAN